MVPKRRDFLVIVGFHCGFKVIIVHDGCESAIGSCDRRRYPTKDHSKFSIITGSGLMPCHGMRLRKKRKSDFLTTMIDADTAQH